MKNLRLVVLTVAVLTAVHTASAWDYEGHRLINQLALASLPTNFPAFVREPAAAERVAFLAGEPDRWRNVQDLSFKHASGPDHYIDIEQLNDYGLTPKDLPLFRADFIGQLAVIRQQNPGKFPKIDPLKNQDHTRELVGLLPWSITENFGKLKSGFAYLSAYQEEGGTSEEISNAQQNIVYVMGTMGHMVGDSAQPLHTTVHHHGWVGANPKDYSTNSRIHSWIDGGYFAKVGLPKLQELQKQIRPAKLVMIDGQPAKADQMFSSVLAFIVEQNKTVETLYQMDKEGRLSGNGTRGLEGKAFLEKQMLAAGQLLGDLWYTSWQQAPPDNFLKSQLNKRNQSGK